VSDDAEASMQRDSRITHHASGDGWAARLETDAAATRAFLERDLAWNAYALADLEPPLVEHARFWLAARAGEDRAGLLVYAPPEFTVIELTGAPDGVEALLAAAELPGRTQIIAQIEHRAAVEARYQSEEWDPMWRMALTPEAFRPPDGVERARRLTVEDLPAARDLYTARDYFAPFSDGMLADGVYYGVWQAGRLVAAAGTHVIARADRVAAVGNVYTAPAARGRGYARLTTAAVARDLLAEGCRCVILNVRADNAPAIAVYRRLGFAKTRDFWEVVDATLRPKATA
jgi:ribosomal protein S18 acetylase RimI-like enzyme